MEEQERFMKLALEQAGLARAAGEVPVGAVVVLDGEVVGVGNYRLVGATLYCTVEPCLMCFGAAMLARVSEVVYGAADPKVGAASQLESLWDAGAGFNHRIRTRGGLLAEPAATLLRDFFRERRPSSGNDVGATAG
jgi:tRNA(adenine34) deaminase